MKPIDYIKYLTNEASEEEKVLFYETLQKDNRLEKEFLSIKKIWDMLQLEYFSVADTRKKELFKEFWKKSHSGNKHKIVKVYRILRYAAIFLLLFTLPITYFTGRKSGVPSNSFSTVTCALGDKSSVILPDSTIVCLNSGSKLMFNNNFEKSEREIILEGEAYFKVTKDTKNPFKVKTSGIEVEVLGTEFNLKAYLEEEKISVTLIEGSVKISSDAQNVRISPNQKLVYNKHTKRMVKQKLTDVSPETEWKEGRLVFRNESLADLELKLERWFDVDIVFEDDEVKTKRYTGILERESILETISYFGISKYVGYKIEGNEITFYSKK